jgi:hypothetical protein
VGHTLTFLPLPAASQLRCAGASQQVEIGWFDSRIPAAVPEETPLTQAPRSHNPQVLHPGVASPCAPGPPGAGGTMSFSDG